jgi:hypothetical protein
LGLEAYIETTMIKNEKLRQAQSALLDSLERFKICIEQLELLRQKKGFNTDSAFERRSLALLRTIRFQTGLAKKSLALAFPAGGDRTFGLNQAAEILTELASLPIDDPVVFQCRIELVTIYRQLGLLEKCQEGFRRLKNSQQKKPLTPELQFQAEAELIRYLLAAGKIDEAVKKAEEEYHNSKIYPDYDLAKLEILLALNYRIRENSEQQTGLQDQQARQQAELNQRVLNMVRKIDRQSGAYWGRRARMMLGTSYSAETNHVDAPLLKMLAEDQFQSGQYTEAVRFFELASRQAEVAGNHKEAFQNAVSAIAVLGNILKKLETAQDQSVFSETELTSCRRRTADALRKVSKQFPEQPQAAELHLKAIDLTAQAVLKNENPLDDYLVLLKEHTELWTDSVKIPPLLLRTAILLESQGQTTDALSILEKIPNHSVAGIDAVNTAQRCFSTETNDMKIAEWFERRIPAEKNATWNQADSVSAMNAAERRIQSFNATKNIETIQKTEQLLRNALEHSPELKPVTKVQIQAMLVTALNDQDKNEDAMAILKMLDDDKIKTLTSAEKLTFYCVQIKLLAETGKVQDAVDLLKIRLKQYPNDISLLKLLAEILSRQKDPNALKKALEIWTLIAEKIPKDTETWWTAREQMIEIYLKQNKIAEAKKELELLSLFYPELGGEPRKSRLNNYFKEK